MTDPISVTIPTAWNAWLAANPQATEVWVLFHKKARELARKLEELPQAG